MDPIEIDAILKSFRIIADTREQNTSKAKKRIRSIKVPVERATLRYGDYCWNADINERPLHAVSATIKAPCVIERKMSLDELAGNFTRGRKRFQREFERAAEQSAKVSIDILPICPSKMGAGRRS